MTEQELDALVQIWKGKTSWGPEWEQVLDETAKKPGQTLRQRGTAGTSVGTPPQVRC
jgi:hypothetical protein